MTLFSNYSKNDYVVLYIKCLKFLIERTLKKKQFL